MENCLGVSAGSFDARHVQSKMLERCVACRYAGIEFDGMCTDRFVEPNLRDVSVDLSSEPFRDIIAAGDEMASQVDVYNCRTGIV